MVSLENNGEGTGGMKDQDHRAKQAIVLASAVTSYGILFGRRNFALCALDRLALRMEAIEHNDAVQIISSMFLFVQSHQFATS